MAEQIVSEILMKTTQFQPTTNGYAATALLRVLALDLTEDDDMVVVPYSLTGSSSDLNIRPLLSCVDDIDIMFRTNRDVVIPEFCGVPDDNFMKSMVKSVNLFHMKPITSYPGYMNILEVGNLEWDETGRRHIFSPHDKGLLSDESNSAGFHSKMFFHSLDEILRIYRGRIREYESGSLLVSEKGVTKVVGVGIANLGTTACTYVRDMTEDEIEFYGTATRKRRGATDPGDPPSVQ